MLAILRSLHNYSLYLSDSFTCKPLEIPSITSAAGLETQEMQQKALLLLVLKMLVINSSQALCQALQLIEMFHATFHDTFTCMAHMNSLHCDTIPKEISDKIYQQAV